MNIENALNHVGAATTCIMKILNNVVENGKTGMWVNCILYLHVGIDMLLRLQCMLALVLV